MSPNLLAKTGMGIGLLAFALAATLAFWPRDADAQLAPASIRWVDRNEVLANDGRYEARSVGAVQSETVSGNDLEWALAELGITQDVQITAAGRMVRVSTFATTAEAAVERLRAIKGSAGALVRTWASARAPS